MKAFKAFPAGVNLEPRWVVRVVEDGGDWSDVPGLPFYETEAEADAVCARLEAVEDEGE